MALAPDGRGWVPVTFGYRTVRLEETGVDVPNVLVGVDDETGTILIIPSQSTPRLKAARELVKDEVFQVRIPHELEDILVLLADQFGASPSKFTPALLRFYLTEASERRALAVRLVKLSQGPLARGRRGVKLSFRGSSAFTSSVRRTSKAVRGASKSALARGAIIAAKEDLLDGRSPSRTEKMQAVAHAL